MNWVESTLGSSFELYQPQTITTKDLIENGKYQVYGANGVIGRYDKFNHEEPQLLVTCRGATCGAVNISSPYAWINGNAMVVKPKRKDVDIRFVEFFFRGAVDLTKAITGAAQPQITRQSLSPIIFRYPPLPIQQKIVFKLDAIFAEIDKAIASAEANAKNAEALFKSYLNQVYEGESNWKKSSIGEALSVIKNGINSEQNKTPIGNKITRIETIAKKKFDFERVGYATLTEDEKERAKLMRGDILFSHINSPIHVGKTAIYEAEEEIYHGINLLLMRTSKDVNPYYFNYFLNQLFASGYWEKNCKKSVNQASVNQKDISKVEFKFPKLHIQEEIVIKLDALLEEVDKSKKSYTSKASELANLKKSILNQAFDGKLLKE